MSWDEIREDPWITNQDHEGALLCMQMKRHLKAVHLLHGGGFIDPDTLDCWDEPKEVQALMRAGPIFHLGPERRGFSWSRPRNRRNDNYLISLSKNRKDHPTEDWVFEDLNEMIAKARELGVRHAYVWKENPEEPQGRGFWDYVRTGPAKQILIPYGHDTQRVLSDLRTLLEAAPPSGDSGGDHAEEVFEDFDPGEFQSLQYADAPLIEGARYTLQFGGHWQYRLTLAADPNGKLYALMPQVRRPGTSPGDYGEIPLTEEEREQLVARVADTYPPSSLRQRDTARAAR